MPWKGLVAAVTSLNVYGSNANFTPVLHLSLSVLSVFLQPVHIRIAKPKMPAVG